MPIEPIQFSKPLPRPLGTGRLPRPAAPVHFGAEATDTLKIKSPPPPADTSLISPDKSPAQLEQDVNTWLLETFIKRDPAWMGTPLMIKKMARAGLTGAGLSQSLDTKNRLPLPKAATVMDSLFYTFPNPAAWMTLNSHLAAFPLMVAGTELQKSRHLAPLLSGDAIGSLAIPSENPGQAPYKITTTATPEGTDWVLNTEADLFIPNGSQADTVLVLAKAPTAEGKGSEDVAFVIDQFWERPEIEVKTNPDDPTARTRVGLKNLKLSQQHLLGGAALKGKALDLGLVTMGQARTLNAAMLSGQLRSLFDRTLFFATSRIQRDTPILNDENILTRLAEMANDVFATAALTQAASHRQDHVLREIAKHGLEQFPSGKQLADPLRTSVVLSAAAKLVAEEAVNRQSIESLQVLDGAGLIDNADKAFLKQLGSWTFPKVDGTTDLNRLLIAYSLRKLAEANPHKKVGLFKRLRQATGQFKFKNIFSPSNPMTAADKLLRYQDQLFDKTFAMVQTQPIAKANPIVPGAHTDDPPGLEQFRPQIRDSRIFLPLADMMVEREKCRAVLKAARANDNDTTSRLQAKLIIIDSTKRFLSALERIHQANGHRAKVDWLHKKLGQFSLIGGTPLENRHKIVTTLLKRARENFETDKGQDRILSLLMGGFNTPEHLMALSRRLSLVGHVPENFIPAHHIDTMISMGHKLNRILLPGILKIKQVDVPQADLDRLRELHQNRMVFFTPNHPTGPCEITTSYDVVGKASPKTGYIRPMFMAADFLFGGPFKHIFPWFGAFSVARSQENNKSIAFIEKSAEQGENVIIVYPEGESSFLNHTVLPFKYGTANTAVKTATSPSAKKPVTVLPAAFVFPYIAPIQKAVHGRMAQLEKYLEITPPNGTMDPEVLLSPSSQARRLKQIITRFVAKTVDDLNRVTPEQEPSKVPNLPPIQQMEWLKQELLQRFELKYLHQTVEGYPLSRMRRLTERMNSKSSLALTKKQREAIRFDQYLLRMIKHLAGFQPNAYENRHSLNQDQFSEVIIKIEQATGVCDKVRKGIMGLEYFGPRKAVIRMAEPIHVNEWLKENEGRYTDLRDAAAQITHLMQSRTQAKLDEIYAQLNETQTAWYPNPLL